MVVVAVLIVSGCSGGCLVPLQFVPVFSTYQAAATSWQLPYVRSPGVQQVAFIFCMCLSF